MKATRINRENKRSLERQFGLQHESLELESGMWLISTNQFEMHGGLLSQKMLVDKYHLLHKYEEGSTVSYTIMSKLPVGNPLFSHAGV